jgi:prepilin-type N-terminal cleavage/methylation domain-containing protein
LKNDQACAPTLATQRSTLNAQSRAFTLIELLVVIAIIAILAATTLPMIPAVNDQARIGTCEARLQQLGVALRPYVEDYHAYPANLRALYDGRVRRAGVPPAVRQSGARVLLFVPTANGGPEPGPGRLR